MDIKVLGKNFLLINEVRIKINDVSSYMVYLGEFRDAYNSLRKKVVLSINVSGHKQEFGQTLFKYDTSNGREFLDEKSKILSELDAIFVKKEYKNADDNELIV